MQITWKWNEKKKNKYSGGNKKMPFVQKNLKTWNTADYAKHSQDIGLLSYDDINSTDGLFP